MNWTYRLWSAAARAYSLVGGGKAVRPGLRILCYHSVGTPLAKDCYGLSVPFDRFERQMRQIASGCFGKPVALGQAGDSPADARICVTFGDGYKDALTRIAPLMSRLGLPFTVCVTPDLVGDKSGVYLSEEDVAVLAAAPGAEIGAHGLSHRRLTEREEWTARRVQVMSYPHGCADRRVRAAAARAGFAVAACSRYGLNGPDRDRLMLCRTEIVAWDDEPAFVQKMMGAWDWYRFRHPDPAQA